MTDRPLRFPMDRPVEFRLSNMRDSPPLHGRTVNISSAGVLFRTEHRLDIGRKIQMVIRVSDPNSLDVDLHLLGVIVRSGPGWAAARVHKHRLIPIAPHDIRPGSGNTAGTPAGL